MSANFVIQHTAWAESKQALTIIRTIVFIEEQKVPEDLEWDQYDETALHFLAVDSQDKPIGCARLVNNQIGRMAVLKAHRQKGVGQALLKAAVSACQSSGYQLAKLSAQAHAITFYEAYGFKVVSEPYLDANIWHVDMQLNI